MAQVLSLELITQMTGPFCYCDVTDFYFITNNHEFFITDGDEPLIYT